MGSSQDNYAINSSAILSTVFFGVCVFYFMPNLSQPQRVKSSAVLVKSTYITEFLSDALSTKYDVCMNSDALLSSYSYQPSSWYKSSAVVRIRSPEETRKMRSGYAILMAGYGVNSMILACRALKRYVDGDEAFIIEVVSFACSLSSFLLFLLADIATVKNLFKPNNALRATIYFNTEDENWVKSLDAKAFNSSEHLEVSTKWVAVALCLGLASIAFLYIIVLACFAMRTVIFDKGEAGSKVNLPLVYNVFNAAFACLGLVNTTKTTFRMIRRSVSTLDVQLAQSVREKDAERSDALKFDVAKVVQMFANDIANSGEKSIASVGTYCDFIITEPEGALVYGRLRGKGISENV
ncbi:hypothetical protein V1520DRAFT_80710 [Lipomyces starkeyi]|uniref:Uncharacterized protein n=1 Tax=Lipomyces starkeyi NRRL Y-11557 TaxID=675824 RepID=A0A1E3QGK4_LIPST|nr:hypothetical protein LIPSTDRAFT_732 [Lipomyces starkeyi NRRL Y-11557]